MTVRELVDKLKTFDDTCIVAIPVSNYPPFWGDIRTVTQGSNENKFVVYLDYEESSE